MKIVIGLGVVVVLLVGLVLLLPFLVDLNKYQDQYRPLIEEALNRKVTLADIRLTIWPRLGLRIGGVTVLDDPAFSSGPFASLTSLEVGVKLLPLLSKKIEVEEITLRDPVIAVVKNHAGVMNVSSMGGAMPAQAPEPGTPPPASSDPLQILALFAVDRVSIEGGKVTYRDLSTVPVAEYQVQDLDLSVRSVHLGQMPTVRFKATVQPLNLPISLDGSFGPLVERLELKQYDFAMGVGKMVLALKGALVGGVLDATLSSPLIDMADLPVSLPLTRPVQIKDLLVVAQLPYPLKEGVPPLEVANIPTLGLAVVMGHSSLNIKGSILGGQADVTVTSPSVKTTDLPVAVPLAKPVEIKDLTVRAKTRVPFKPDVPPLEMADVPDLRLGVVLGRSVLDVKGSVLNGQALMAVSSPSLQTGDLPVETGLAKSIEIKNLLINVGLKGPDARVSLFSAQLFNGQIKAQGGMVMGSAGPPFTGTLTIDGLQLGPALEALSPDSRVSMSGTAAMKLAVTGRGVTMPDVAQALEGAGHLRVKDGTIEGVNLLEEAVTLLKAAGVSLGHAKGTVFSTIETDVTVKRGLATVQKLLVDSHDFQATGGGTVGFDRTLRLAVNLNLSQALSQKLAGSSPFAKLAMKEGRVRLPLIITGTMEQPSYGLDMKGLAGTFQEQVQEQANEAVKGLLEGTTTPGDLQRQGRDILKGLFGR
ncbi:AsmA family protein [Nitrospira sp. NS4]|uniref:AsmA family protein n=1 Tax=Nitrospira sp. NS4 TaxID=3414498 RepID=UPI003C2D1668